MTKKKQPTTQVQMLPMSAVEVNAGQLEGLPANPREIRDEKFEKLKANIQKYPELLEYRSLMVYPMPNGKHIIIGGNMRYRAMQELGYTEVPCVIIPAETPVEKLGAYTILDNNGFGKWDWDLLANEWSDWNMEDLGLDWEFAGFGEMEENDKAKEDKVQEHSLNERFVVPPFSVLDSRQGYWQERKAAWKEKIGARGWTRSDTLIDSIQIKYQQLYQKTYADRMAKGLSFADYILQYCTPEEREKAEQSTGGNGVSLFDPVLAECLCKWYTPKSGSAIIDCFAGDVLKGMVFSMCGHNFTGIEIRPEQVAENESILAGSGLECRYICDDGQNIASHIPSESADLLFSCPPYYDLEVYSDLPNDASAQKDYDGFIRILDNAFKASVGCLRNNRFVVVVVGDVRDRNGEYRDFPGDVKRIFKECGCSLYNELIYVEMSATKQLRAATCMRNRKTVKSHQNVLVFFKGDLSKIQSEFPIIEVE